MNDCKAKMKYEISDKLTIMQTDILIGLLKLIDSLDKDMHDKSDFFCMSTFCSMDTDEHGLLADTTEYVEAFNKGHMSCCLGGMIPIVNPEYTQKFWDEDIGSIMFMSLIESIFDDRNIRLWLFHGDWDSKLENAKERILYVLKNGKAPPNLEIKSLGLQFPR